MTCIVGLTHDGVTYIGGDSLGSNGHSKVLRKDKKVFKLQDTDKAVIGYTSSFRMGQLLMYARGLLDGRLSDKLDHEYLVTEFIPNVMRLFERSGYGKNDNGEKSGGCFLLGIGNRLYEIDSDYQVGESYQDYASVGCGEEFALGSLHSTATAQMSPEERLRGALQAASAFSVGVSGPFHIVNTANDKVVTFDD